MLTDRNTPGLILLPIRLAQFISPLPLLVDAQADLPPPSPLLPLAASSPAMMSHASSSSASRRSGTSTARVRAPLAVAPPTQPLAVAPTPVFDGDAVDDETGLPLIVCPFCKDLTLIADTTRYSTKNLGRRYFKCPRSIPGDRSSCPMYKFQEDYVAYLKKNRYLGSNSMLEVVPELLQEIQDVKLELHDVKEQVEDMKTGAGRKPRISCCCVVLTFVNLFFLLLAILLVGMK